MASTQDVWYVRLPNGRVVRSRSIASLRQHLRKGHIPRDSRIRRAGGNWQPLDEVHELADLVPARSKLVERNGANNRTSPSPNAAAASPTGNAAWRKLGVRGLARELLDALDSTLHGAKLTLAGFLGVLACVGWIAFTLVNSLLDGVAWDIAAVSIAMTGMFLGTLAMALVTQITFIELSRIRQPRRAELWPRALLLAVRLGLALLLVLGVGAGLIWTLRWLPGWMQAQESGSESFWTYAAAAVLILRLVLEVVFWPMLALAPLLLGPILVIEECTVPRAVLEWWRMLRQHLGRIFLYEAFASALGLVFTAPLVAPIWVASASLNGLSGLSLLVGQATLLVLTGIACTPLLAYLLVANVFIYLNLRYEFFHSART